MRLLVSIFILALLAASSAVANLIPYDPHILYATGGDATPITSTNPIQIILSQGGGGIFVFQNETLMDLSNLELDVQFPFSSFPNGFTLVDTIFVPTAGSTTFSDAQFNGVDCAHLGGPTTSNSCLTMKFGLIPGPLIDEGQSFVLDFDKPGPNGYTGVDASVANGTYTGGTDISEGRIGEWPSNGTAFVTAIPAVPEPGHYAGLLLVGLAVLLYRQLRKQTAR